MAKQPTSPRKDVPKVTPFTKKASTESDITPAEAREIAKEVFLWGMHPVAIYHLRYNRTKNKKDPKHADVNRLHWDRKPITAADRSATTPNATTLYGHALLDLAKEPVVVTVPEIRDHYWSIQFADNYARWWPMIIGSQFNARTTEARAHWTQLDRQATGGLLRRGDCTIAVGLRLRDSAHRAHRRHGGGTGARQLPSGQHHADAGQRLGSWRTKERARRGRSGRQRRVPD